MFREEINPLFIEKIQKLTLVVYKVTDLIGEIDPLRSDFRRECVAFFSHVSLAARGSYDVSPKVLLESIHRILGYLSLLKHCKKLTAVHVSVLEAAYLAVSVKLSRLADAEPKDLPTSSRKIPVLSRAKNTVSVSLMQTSVAGPPAPLSDRQQFVLRFAKTHNQFQLKELANHFPSLSEKTIRNDLLVLCEHGLLARFGVAPRSYYQVVSGAEISKNDAEYPYTRAEAIMHNAESVKV